VRNDKTTTAKNRTPEPNHVNKHLDESLVSFPRQASFFIRDNYFFVFRKALVFHSCRF